MCMMLVRIFWGRSTSCFIYGFGIQIISEKNSVEKFY